MPQPKLLQDAAAGNARFFLQFGGQGAPYLKELQTLYKEEKMRRFFEIALSAVSDALKRAGNTPALPFAVELKKWLEDETTAPSDDQLAIAGVSLGLIQATQLAHYEYLHQMGFDRQEMLKYTIAASGHSQGLITASFAALSLSGSDYETAIAKYIQYLFLMGVRAQETFTATFASDIEKATSEALGAKNPAPMVAVLGEEHPYVEGLVKVFNAHQSADKKIFVSLYNTPSNRIISGARSSLIAFHEQNKTAFEAKGIKYVYLRASCPFHCELMAPIKPRFAPDIEAIGFNYTGADLKFPVYSFADGSNLQNEGALGMRMCDDLMVQPLYWDKSMKPVADNMAITHILDFGPGKTSQRLSQETLQAFQREIPIFAVAFAKDLKILLAE